jgi:cell division septum initiation protein DivIVA
MRIAIPDEMRRAERIIREKERTKAQAKEEAERIVKLARQEAAELAANHSVARTAGEEAAMIRERARQEAQKIVAGADEYAFEVLCDLEQDLKRALTVIENGIRAVEARQGGPGEGPVPQSAGPEPGPAVQESPEKELT